MPREGDLFKNAKGGAAIYRGGQYHVIAQDGGELGMIKALSDGRMALPSGAALRSPKWAAVIDKLSLYDPQFDVANAGARVATRKSFEAGKDHQNIVALNTAIGHLGKLNDLIPTLHNTPVPLLNAGKRMVSEATGSPQYTNYEAEVPAVAGEVNKVFTGGPGDAQGRAHFAAPFDSTRSEAQLRGAVKSTADLLQGRLDALGETYRSGMGRAKDPMTFLTPEAAATFKRLQEAPAGEPAPHPGHMPVGPDVGHMSDGDLLKALGHGG